MSDLGKLSYFLGMELQMSKQGMMLHQRKYVKEILKRFMMDDSTPASSPIKPNMKLEKHGEEDKVDATLFKQIVGSLRYVCNSRPDICFSVELVNRCMSEPKVSHMKMLIDVEIRKIEEALLDISFKYLMPQSHGAEYIAGSYVMCQKIWFKYMLEEIEVEVKKPLVLQIDNKSAINLAKNPFFAWKK
ncbi:uncharacterized mitochondrial protein AtMg00810-like [Lathyrus oleraceus]|uniref:uncharacterized mitochondrial protein AtMg00810-like n=1 Tax=Pisum sativum TaxID=3888 RepID=UPI0021D1AAFF|nr:uncharacterized mitochondrial protein AtMg00810-like [Pisum sativum]